nr:esterase [uncultured bacterium]
MDPLPVNYLAFLSVMTLSVLAAAVAPARPPWIGTTAAALATVPNELPLVAFLLLGHSTWLAVTEDKLLAAPLGWVWFGDALAVEVAFLLLLCRGLRAPAVVADALIKTFGAVRQARGTRPVRWTLLPPLPVRPWAVKRIGNLSYGPAGRRNRLDVYRHRSAPGGAPVLVYLHGGAYFFGSKRRESRAMLHRFADRGWVCVAATYRVRPQVQFPDHPVDAKRALAWVREHAADLGADPTTVVLAGSSAGAHLTALMALTRNNPAFQPGFEEADTSVTAAVCLYGHYGLYYGRDERERPSSSPLLHDAAGAPPFFIAHGDRDTQLPVSAARAMRASSGRSPPRRSCTSSCLAPNTVSTCSGQCGSTPSWPASRPSPPTPWASPAHRRDATPECRACQGCMSAAAQAVGHQNANSESSGVATLRRFVRPNTALTWLAGVVGLVGAGTASWP